MIRGRVHLRSQRLILIANNGDLGGGEVMLLEMARVARDVGVDVGVIAPRAPGGVADRAVAEGFPAQTFAGNSRGAQLWALRRQLRGSHDVLWCNGLAPALATAGRRGRVAHIHQLPTGRHVIAARVAGVGALHTVVPSQAMADLLPGARVMHNWTSPFNVPPSERPGSVCTLGFLGRLTRTKGVDVLLHALRILDDQRPGHFRLRMAGEARFAPAQDRDVIAQALAPVAQLVDELGWVDREDFFGGIDLAVFPSIVRESFGLVAAEAMSARVPFVISDRGALPEVAGPKHPFVAKAGDAAALAASIRVAADLAEHQPEQLAVIVDDAAHRWKREFSPDAGRRRFLSVLADLGLASLRAADG